MCWRVREAKKKESAREYSQEGGRQRAGRAEKTRREAVSRSEANERVKVSALAVAPSVTAPPPNPEEGECTHRIDATIAMTIDAGFCRAPIVPRWPTMLLPQATSQVDAFSPVPVSLAGTLALDCTAQVMQQRRNSRTAVLLHTQPALVSVTSHHHQ